MLQPKAVSPLKLPADVLQDDTSPLLLPTYYTLATLYCMQPGQGARFP